MYFIFFFFFKQKTSYEMRISDWSSDVCSSDLGRLNKRKRIERVLSLREQLFMERRGFGADRFEGVHEIRAPIRISAELHSDPSFSPPLRSFAVYRLQVCLPP